MKVKRGETSDELGWQFDADNGADLLQQVQKSHRFGVGTIEAADGVTVSSRSYALVDGATFTWYPPPAGVHGGLQQHATYRYTAFYHSSCCCAFAWSGAKFNTHVHN